MTLVGLALNATHARAAAGVADSTPCPLALDPGGDTDLPLAISLQQRTPEVGKAGRALSRQLPHLACFGILPRLGSNHVWTAGRHRISVERAVTLVAERLRPALSGAKAIGLTVPSYLNHGQAGQLLTLLGKSGLPAVGTATTPLALALALCTEQPVTGTVALIDADDHALTISVLGSDRDSVRVLDERSIPELSLRSWRETVLDGVADRCVLHSRRDPRDSATAEQLLYDQLDHAFAVCRQGGLVELDIQTASWFQNLILRPEEIEGWCADLVRVVLDTLDESLAAPAVPGPPQVYAVTAAAATLPGLALALYDQTNTHAPVTVLGADAAVLAAHDLAARWQSGELARGHHDTTLTFAPDSRLYQTMRPDTAQRRRRDTGR
jgi:hypothetical protein